MRQMHPFGHCVETLCAHLVKCTSIVESRTETALTYTRQTMSRFTCFAVSPPKPTKLSHWVVNAIIVVTIYEMYVLQNMSNYAAMTCPNFEIRWLTICNTARVYLVRKSSQERTDRTVVLFWAVHVCQLGAC